MFKQKIWSIVLVILVVISGIGVSIWAVNRNTKSEVKDSSKIQVVTSFYPLYNFAKEVGGDKIQVSNITPSGGDAHDFEPTILDNQKVLESDLFIFQGKNFDTWAEKLAKQKTSGKNLEMASNFDLKKAEEHAEEENHSEEKASGKDHSELDPHIWLDPVLAQKQIEIIRDKLIETDSKNKDFYNKNAQGYIEKLKNLDQKFSSSLRSCKKSEIVVSHKAFSYLADRYNFKIEAISGLEPSQEPTQKEIENIVEIIKKDGLKFVFYEEQLNPELAKTVANESGAKIKILRSIESLTKEEEKNGDSYITIMEKNLESLKQGLECQ
jgi:zinc transport system substrate-binding protein